MNVPFTVEQFLAVFVAYNTAIWPTQIVAYLLGLFAVAAAWSRRSIAFPQISLILALMWAWNGIGYQFLFFSPLNPAANLFAVFFVLQAILFAASAVVAKDLQFRIECEFRSLSGLAIIGYAMVVYPILGILAGHGLMAGPMFGVAPCPTTIFTIGILLLAHGRWIVWLSIIPLLWSVVGLAAAVQLGIPEDLGLAVAGFVLLLFLGHQMTAKRFLSLSRFRSAMFGP